MTQTTFDPETHAISTPLPVWVTVNAARTEAEGRLVLEVDRDRAYPDYLERLGVETPDQYWLEVARRCLTKDLQELVRQPITLRILATGDWNLADHPPGKGDAAGAAEFRRHWERIKG